MIKFYYADNIQKQEYEAVATQVINRMRNLTQLPDQIEIHFMKLEPRMYGGVDKRSYHRIAINKTLSIKEMIQILVHELIHVSQRHTGQFSIINGWYYWNGKPVTNRDPETLPIHEYNNLPWEADVAAKQQIYLNNVLKIENNT